MKEVEWRDNIYCLRLSRNQSFVLCACRKKAMVGGAGFRGGRERRVRLSMMMST